MITVKQLIQAAPFPDDVKSEMISKTDTFSPEKKYEVENLCWSLINAEIQNKLNYAIEKNIAESVFQDKDTHLDVPALEQKLIEEVVQKFGETDTEEKIDEVRHKLQELTPSPTPKPDENTTSASSVNPADQSPQESIENLPN